MINTVATGASLFYQFFQIMPTVIRTFVFLAVGLWAVSVILHLIFR